MPILLDTIMTSRSTIIKSASMTLNEAKAASIPTAFLCHSHLDEDLVRGIISLFSEHGWNVYVDWEDASMPSIPDRNTAIRIQQKITDLKYFIFLATPNSVKSRWCPWEIGFADGKKNIDNILVIPTADSSGNYYGNEYIALYKRIDFADTKLLASWKPNQTTGGVYIRDLS